MISVCTHKLFIYNKNFLVVRSIFEGRQVMMWACIYELGFVWKNSYRFVRLACAPRLDPIARN